jgi:hypothetical protein
MKNTVILPRPDEIEMKREFRENTIINMSICYRNACEVNFATVEGEIQNGEGNKVLNNVSKWHKKASCVYLEENSSAPPNEVHYLEIKKNRKGIVYVNNLSDITDNMFKSISKVGNVLIIPYTYLQDQKFHQRLSFACWIYFIRTYIVVPKNTPNKQLRSIYSKLCKNKYNPKPQFDVRPTSDDIKREFKIRKKYIHDEILGGSLACIGCIVTVAFGIAGLVLGGLVLGVDAGISGIRYAALKSKENKVKNATNNRH